MQTESREAMLDLLASLDELESAAGADSDSIDMARSMRYGVEDLIARYDAWYPRCAVCGQGAPTVNEMAVYVCTCNTVHLSRHGVIQIELRT